MLIVRSDIGNNFSIENFSKTSIFLSNIIDFNPYGPKFCLFYEKLSCDKAGDLLP